MSAVDQLNFFDDELRRSLEKLEFPKLLSLIRGLCQTEIGEKYITDIPFYFDMAALEEEYRLVDQAELLLQGGNPPSLYGAVDVRPYLIRASKEGSMLQGKELLQISRFLHIVDITRKRLLKEKDLSDIAKVAYRLYPDPMLEYNISNSIDEDGNVRDSASKELHRVRSSLHHLRASLRKKLLQIARSFADMEYSDEDIFTQRDGRFVLPIKADYKHKVSGLIHGQSATGQTVFLEPSSIVEANNEIVSLQFEEQKEVERILRDLTSQVREVYSSIMQDVDVIAYLDSLFARAQYAVKFECVIPRVNGVRRPRLMNARHPLLFAKLGKERVMPLNLFLSDDQQIVVISGPNSGGKTVAIKTIGMFVLMTLSAVPLPAAPGTEIPLYRKIFTEIGDNQSIENDLSTFTSRITHFVRILNEADENTIVFVDELGEETEPDEGAAIASAVLEAFRDRGVTAFVTTHNSGLKAFVSDAPKMVNAAMEFDQVSLQPTFRLSAGRPGSSYAFEIAERTGLSSEVIARARSYAGESRNRLEGLLLRVESLENELRERIIEIKHEQELAESLRQDYEKKLHNAKKEAAEIRTKALAEAQDLVRDVNKRIESVIKELRENSANKESIKNARSSIKEIKKKVSSLLDTHVMHSNSTFVIGDDVALRGTLLVGRVIEKTNDQGELLIDINGLKMRVHESELEKASRERKQTGQTAVEVKVNSSTKLDIRGMRSYEIQTTVEKFIDEAYLSGLHIAEIVHGTGTGALKKTVEGILRNHPFVASFRSGDLTEGGQGVTVIELKEN
ncbi:MAG: endonuclease MutS2 [Candidatus Kryptoniota bacterium]